MAEYILIAKILVAGRPAGLQSNKFHKTRQFIRRRSNKQGSFPSHAHHNNIPSLTLSYKAFPCESNGSKCFRSGSGDRLLLIHPEKASCSSRRTECVVPSLEASDMPPSVSRFSFLDTTCLNLVPASVDLRSMHSWNYKEKYKLNHIRF